MKSKNLQVVALYSTIQVAVNKQEKVTWRGVYGFNPDCVTIFGTLEHGIEFYLSIINRSVDSGVSKVGTIDTTYLRRELDTLDRIVNIVKETLYETN